MKIGINLLVSLNAEEIKTTDIIKFRHIVFGSEIIPFVYRCCLCQFTGKKIAYLFIYLFIHNIFVCDRERIARGIKKE